MASSNSCICEFISFILEFADVQCQSVAAFGLHRKEILALKNEWSALADSAHHRKGVQILSALSRRNKKFYFSNTHFDFPDYPVKILPYPENQPIPTTADTIHDILTIKPGNSVTCVNLHDGMLSESASISGADMVNIMFNYLTNKSAENLRNVVLPLSAPISKPKCGSMDTGLGKVDVNMLVPPFFRSQSRIFLPDSKEGWTARFLIPPAFSTMAYEHYICGQIWLFCPPDEGHLNLWYSNESGVEKTMEFVQRAEKLFVWVSLEPSLMVLPPHCFQSVFTLTAACDIGVRAGSDFWEQEIGIVVQSMGKEMNKSRVIWSEEYWVEWTREVMRDFRVWVSWVEDIKREPSHKEKELMKKLAPLMKTLKVILEA